MCSIHVYNLFPLSLPPSPSSEDCCESATGLVKNIEETEAMAHELHEKFKNKS